METYFGSYCYLHDTSWLMGLKKGDKISLKKFPLQTYREFLPEFFNRLEDSDPYSGKRYTASVYVFKNFFAFDQNIQYVCEGIQNDVSIEDYRSDNLYSTLSNLSWNTQGIMKRGIQNLIGTCISFNLCGESLSDVCNVINDIFRDADRRKLFVVPSWNECCFDKLKTNEKEVVKKANSTLLQLGAYLLRQWQSCDKLPVESLDESQGKWVSWNEAASIRHLTRKTLNKYREDGITNPDGLFGRDSQGFYWKRDAKRGRNASTFYFIPHDFKAINTDRN